MDHWDVSAKSLTMRRQLAVLFALLRLRALEAFQNATVSGAGCERTVVLGLWTYDGAKGAARREGIVETWWRPGCAVWLSATPLAGVAADDVVVTGGPGTYAGTAYRGLVGLERMRARFPDRRWYGVLGDDNYVHWPSLVRGLERLDAAARLGRRTLPLCAGETGETESGERRFWGGAGIFTNAEFTDALVPRLADLAAATLEGENASSPLDRRAFLHDVFFSAFVRDRLRLGPDVAPRGPREGPDLLTHADFLFSSEPAFYACAHFDLARSWLHPGQEKGAKFPTSKAPISVVFHSFRLIFGRGIISRNGLEARTFFFWNARARNGQVEATSNHPFAAQASRTRASKASTASSSGGPCSGPWSGGGCATSSPGPGRSGARRGTGAASPSSARASAASRARARDTGALQRGCFRSNVREECIDALRSPRELTARPKMSRIEREPIEIRPF